MIRRLLAAPALAALIVGMTSGIASASSHHGSPPPPVPIVGLTYQCPGGFTAVVTITRDNQYTTEQTLANGAEVFFASGNGRVTVTNETTGTSINLNGSGADTNTAYPDGSLTTVGNGTAIVGLTPTQASELGVPPFAFYTGHLTATVAPDGTIKSATHDGDVIDLCAALS